MEFSELTLLIVCISMSNFGPLLFLYFDFLSFDGVSNADFENCLFGLVCLRSVSKSVVRQGLYL